MISSKLIMALFGLTAAVQLAVPGALIYRHESTLRHGTPYKFKTAPVDPADAFRGRYVALGFEEHQAPLAANKEFARGQKAYATVETDKDGFARFTSLSTAPPKDKAYLKVHVAWLSVDSADLQLPFDRFYLEESVAPAAEEAYWQNNRRGQTNSATYALVRIRNGTGVIEN